MKKLLFSLFCVAILSGLAIPMSPVAGAQATIYVPDDYPTIQQAVNRASPGDTIYVSTGTYYENIILKDGIILRGANPDTTIIDGSGTDSVVKIANGATLATTIDGFTITNGYSDHGGGICGQGETSFTVVNCIIVNNIATSAGGGIFSNSEHSHPTIASSKILNNVAVGFPTYSGGNGGGVALHNSSQALITDCVISGNQAKEYGGGIFAHSYLRIRDATIARNIITENSAEWGGGVSIDAGTALVNNTLVGNTAVKGGGIWSQNHNVADNYIIRNNIVVNNMGGGGIEYYNARGAYESLYVYYNNVWANVGGDYIGEISIGEGEISSDPLFVDAAGGDYHLQSGSPCIDSGDPNPDYNDVDGTRNDMGAYGWSTPSNTPTYIPRYEGGCFIATAAYGSYLDSHVETLRDFRDSYLMTNPVGQALVSTYYEVSPPMAGFIDDHPALKPVVRVGLLPAVAMSEVVVNTTSAQKIAIVGSLLLVSALTVVWLRRKGVLSRF